MITPRTTGLGLHVSGIPQWRGGEIECHFDIEALGSY
jgi:hypothetical protein